MRKRFFLIAGLAAGLIFSACRGLPSNGTGLDQEVGEAGSDNGEPVVNPPDVLPPESASPNNEIPSEKAAALPVTRFPEVWAYLTAGREEYFNDDYPLTDLGYFGAGFNSYGRLTSVPSRRSLGNFSGRVHLVVTCDSGGLTHFILQEGSDAREEAINDLVDAATSFDGLQLDFELVPARDGDAYLSFIKELRSRIPGKVLSVALPAKMSDGNRSQYDYRKITALVDRVFIMAYDQHWGGSRAGPIASTSWCSDIADYALRTVGPDKLIMGIPFYGRGWGDNPNKAWYSSGVDRLMQENNITQVMRDGDDPYFTYRSTTTVKVYFQDAKSISAKLQMYRAKGIRAVGFWTLGQEDPDVWNIVATGK
jgi:hypothetical protein